MKIYTKTGDAGETGLIGGTRVKKHAIRIEAYGTVDELNAALGVTRGHQPSVRVDDCLAQVQHHLFDIGADLASPTGSPDVAPRILPSHVTSLEAFIDACESDLEPLRNFILPAGCTTASHLHFARTVCRRAERRVLELAETEPVPTSIAVYLNRLGDLLFVLARMENKHHGSPDVRWEQQRARL